MARFFYPPHPSWKIFHFQAKLQKFQHHIPPLFNHHAFGNPPLALRLPRMLYVARQSVLCWLPASQDSADLEVCGRSLLQKDGIWKLPEMIEKLKGKERTSVSSCFGLIFFVGSAHQLLLKCVEVVGSFLRQIPNLQSFGGDWDCQKSGWYKVSDEYKTCNATCAAAALTCSTDSSLLSSPGKIKAGQGDDRFEL